MIASLGLRCVLVGVCLSGTAYGQQGGTGELDEAVRNARALIAARDPTAGPLSYEAEYEFTWHAKEVVVEVSDAGGGPAGTKRQLRLEPLDPPATSTGTIRVDVDGESVTIHITPRHTAEAHQGLHQLRQPITIWRNAEKSETGEIRHSEGSALVDIDRTTRSPWPDQLIVPHVIFTAHLAADWNRKFPQQAIWYAELKEDIPFTTAIERDGDDVVVSESYARPGMRTRHGPYTMARVTRYSSVGDQPMPVEVSRLVSGVRETVARIEWPAAVLRETGRPLMPEVIRFERFTSGSELESPLVLWTEQAFRFEPESIRVGANDAGRVTIPAGISVLKRYAPGDPRETEEYIAADGAAAAAVDQRWLLVSGGVVLAIVIVGIIAAVQRNAESWKRSP